MGDVQLSFLMFVGIQCLSSLQHWRDLVAMLSIVPTESVALHADLYAALLATLTLELARMEEDFFEDVEYSQDNFLVPAIQRLCRTCSSVSQHEGLQRNLSTLVRLLQSRFPAILESSVNENETTSASNVQQQQPQHQAYMQQDDSDDDEDEEPPVMVASEEIEASLARSSLSQNPRRPISDDPTNNDYPLLCASVLPHEDVLMACARILDEAVDVSLVREAAAYLNQVEAKRLQE